MTTSAAPLRRTGSRALIAVLAVGSALLAPSGSAQADVGAAVRADTVGGARLASPGLVVDLPPGVPAPPDLPATSWLLADLGTGQVVAAKGAHLRGLPASTLKTLTLLTTLPQADPRAIVRAQADDLVDGTRVGLEPGQPYLVHQLQQATIISSANDAATALARASGGSGGVARTVAQMQAEAVRLGALDTTVRNPTGLDAADQLTSAYDLALVARAAMARPDFRALVITKRVRFPGKPVKGRVSFFEIQNHNRLLYNYVGAVGVKDGYTIKARWTEIGAATRGGRTYLLAALHRDDPSWRPEAAMLDWAFAHGAQARPVGHLVTPGEAAVRAATAISAPKPARTVVGAADRAPAAAAKTSSAGLLAGRERLVGAVGVGAAVLAVLLLGLSARARRGRRRGRPLAPYARLPRR
jgi:D-alanyl-D-alanine carboxypeptidase (penicillin-binding protein 5/6)